mmetsp:Transcript_36427/g.85096  ORF Transcript_36427/g.85096 Transcript_36427/m.85096 type:complete len:254 (+) Transcript_36427:376-1137(+)
MASTVRWEGTDTSGPSQSDGHSRGRPPVAPPPCSRGPGGIAISRDLGGASSTSPPPRTSSSSGSTTAVSARSGSRKVPGGRHPFCSTPSSSTHAAWWSSRSVFASWLATSGPQLRQSKPSATGCSAIGPMAHRSRPSASDGRRVHRPRVRAPCSPRRKAASSTSKPPRRMAELQQMASSTARNPPTATPRSSPWQTARFPRRRPLCLLPRQRRRPSASGMPACAGRYSQASAAPRSPPLSSPSDSGAPPARRR